MTAKDLIEYVLDSLKNSRFCLAFVQQTHVRDQIKNQCKRDYPNNQYVFIDIKKINDDANRTKDTIGWYQILLHKYLLGSFAQKRRTDIEKILSTKSHSTKFKDLLVESLRVLLDSCNENTIMVVDNIELISANESNLEQNEISQFFGAICETHHNRSKFRLLLLGSSLPDADKQVIKECHEAINYISRHTPQAKVEEVVKPPVTGSPSVVHSSQNNGENQDPISINHDNLSEKTKIDRKNWFHRVELFGIRMLSFGNHETSMSEKQKNVLLLVIPIAAIGLLIWLFSGSEKNGIPCWPPSKCISTLTPPTPSPTISVSPSIPVIPPELKIYQDPDGLFQFKYPSTLELVPIPQQSWGQNTIIELYFKEDPKNLAWIQIERFNDSTPEDVWTDEDKDALLASPTDPNGAYRTIERSENRDGCLLYRIESSSGRINHYWCLVISGKVAYRISYEAPVLEYDRLKSEAQIVFDSFQTNQGNL